MVKIKNNNHIDYYFFVQYGTKILIIYKTICKIIEFI